MLFPLNHVILIHFLRIQSHTYVSTLLFCRSLYDLRVGKIMFRCSFAVVKSGHHLLKFIYTFSMFFYSLFIVEAWVEKHVFLKYLK